MRAELLNLPEAWPGCQSWFWHGEQILELLEQRKPVACVELGSWFGGSAIPVARLIKAWGGKLTCVDVWGSVPVAYNYEPTLNTLERFTSNIAEAGVFDDVTSLQMSTIDAALIWKEPIDYLYLDADHSYEGCRADLELWWPHLKIGGLIAGDDYGDGRFGVTQAWDEFEQRHGQQFTRHMTPGFPTPLIYGVKR